MKAFSVEYVGTLAGVTHEAEGLAVAETIEKALKEVQIKYPEVAVRSIREISNHGGCARVLSVSDKKVG